MSAVALAVAALALAVYLGSIVVADAIGKHGVSGVQSLIRLVMLFSMFALLIGAVANA